MQEGHNGSLQLRGTPVACRAVPPTTTDNDSPSDKHDTGDFSRPDPPSRPESGFSGERARLGALLAAVDLPMRGHPQRASTTGRALEHLAGTPHGLGGPCGRRLPPSPRVQDWHKFSPRSQLTPVTLAGRVPSPGRQTTSTAQSSFTGRDRRSCVAVERARPWPLPAAVDVLYYPHVRARPAANLARATGKPRTSWRGQFRPLGLLGRECMSGTSAYDQLSASVAQVKASLQACDTPTPAGPFTGRQRRTTG